MVDSKENYKFDLWVKGLRAIPCYRLYIQRPIFLETNFLNKLILHSFELIISLQRKNFPFFNRGCQYFCVKLCCEHYKKNNLQFNVFTWHLFSYEWSTQTKIKKKHCKHGCDFLFNLNKLVFMKYLFLPKDLL